MSWMRTAGTSRIKSGERIEFKVDKNTYIFEVQGANGEQLEITLDSGAGCNVWPRGVWAAGSRLTPKPHGMRMLAANGTEMACYGQRVVKFRGVEKEPDADMGFPRRT